MGAHHTTSTGPVKMDGPCPVVLNSDIKVHTHLLPLSHELALFLSYWGLVELDLDKSLPTPGSELHFPSVQPSDAGVYICTCRNLIHTSNSRAELLVAGESLHPCPS